MQRIVSRLALGLMLVCCLSTAVGFAQSPPPDPATAALQAQDRITKLEQQVVDARNAGDNAWMLVCSALVLMMTGPGLALFYGGLVRKKNVLATMMQSFILMAVVTVLWAFFGYSLVFHGGNPIHWGLRLPVPARSGRRSRPGLCAARFPSKPSWCTSSCSPLSLRP